MNLCLKIVLIFSILLLLVNLKKRELFKMPGSKENFEQIEIETNLSKFKILLHFLDSIYVYFG